jgi:hypothetical protein
MAFQTPPTFVDGNVLSASQLNILAANQNELAGLSTGVNLGFPDTGIPTDESRYFYVIHAWNNLYLSYSLPTNDSSLRVYYGATLVYTSTGNAVRNVTAASNPTVVHSQCRSDELSKTRHWADAGGKHIQCGCGQIRTLPAV